jgi:uncharacterized protein
MRFHCSVLLFMLLTSSMLAGATDVNSAAYKADYDKWKSELTDDLKKNWLTLVGLFWLKEGTNRVGGDHRDEVPLPEGKVPAQVGTIDFHGGKAVFTAAPGVKVASGDKPVTTIELQPDTSGKPTVLQVGEVRMHMIQRKERYGMRVKDPHSKELAEFNGSQYFPLSQNFVVTANFIPYDKTKKVSVPTQIGQDAEMDSPGYVEFTLNGQKQHLQALDEGANELFFVIKDQTSGKGTYPAGRFLNSSMPKDGKVELDFNRAYNPPCAWTPYATCPLPPKENYMSVPVSAGEKFAGHH